MTTAVTLERQVLGKYLRRSFLGPDYDQKTLCPVAIPQVSFDPTKADDVAPFTPTEVRDSVGYVSLTLHEIDAFQGDVAGGIATVGGVDRMTSVWYTLTRCRFAIRVPGPAPHALTETYQEKLLELFLGLSILESGPPEIHLRQLVQYPPRIWGDSHDSTWRERVLDIPIRRRERRAHAGAQEVA